jgi:hypothetical protein
MEKTLIMKYKYGLLKYKTENIGDEIQSLAAKRFLPKVDIYVDRDNLSNVKSDQKINLIIPLKVLNKV